MDLKENLIACSLKFIAILCALYLVTLPSVDARPHKIQQSSLVEQCCTIDRRYFHDWGASLVTSGTELTPGRGRMVHLYKTPFYHQYINKELCFNNNNPKVICQLGMCEQQYTTQEVIVQERGLIETREIWVPSGCKFVHP